MLKIDYIKRKNTKLFSNFNDIKNLNLTNTYNYNPLFTRFFSLNNTNFNTINLNHKWHLHEIFENESDSDSDSDSKKDTYINPENESENESDIIEEDCLINIYNCSLKNSVNNKKKFKDVFFKIAPLINPYKYLIGKYVHNDEYLFKLPSISDNKTPDNIIYNKMNDPNNSSYIDGFFTFLSSHLSESYNILNSTKFYGSFNSIKNNYKLNIFDDLDMLEDSDFFLENNGKLYNIQNFDDFFEETTKKLKPIKIENNITLSSIKSFEDDMYDNMFDNDDDNNDVKINNENKNENKNENENENVKIDDESSNMNIIDLNDLKSLSIDINEIDNNNNSKKIKCLSDDSSCSSNTSHTEEESENKKDDISIEEINSPSNSPSNSNGNSNTYSNTSYSSMSEEDIIANIPKFPVHVICMEACDYTFDDLIMDDEMTPEEWYASLMQIIMILLVYQKTFNFTHNDLHTKNVMFNYTEAKYVYYIYNENTYKVPTFGKIFKIIDFGRSIYTFDKKIFCSDSYEKDGDAYGQYNCEPFLNHNKPRIEPNMSFDLCRLGCSIFDYLVDDISETTKFLNETNIKSVNYVRKIIIEWCLDDNGTNMLYKSNGQDRYPEFKLYKMIARCVHYHTPESQLERDCFKQYIFEGKVKSKDMLTNIDEIPSMI